MPFFIIRHFSHFDSSTFLLFLQFSSLPTQILRLAILSKLHTPPFPLFFPIRQLFLRLFFHPQLYLFLSRMRITNILSFYFSLCSHDTTNETKPPIRPCFPFFVRITDPPFPSPPPFRHVKHAIMTYYAPSRFHERRGIARNG